MDDVPPMHFTHEELFPRAEPRSRDNFTKKHTAAGNPFGDGHTILDNIRKNDTFASERKENIYYPFASRLDWEVASWLSRLNVSMELTNEFFDLEFVSSISITLMFSHLIYVAG